MKTITLGFLSFLILALACRPGRGLVACQPLRRGLVRRGRLLEPHRRLRRPTASGSHYGGSGSWSATGARGGTASGSHYGTSGSWSAHGAYGGTAYGGHYYGGTYPAYHPPTTVNVYGSGCYNCGGWHAAGAAAAGHGGRSGYRCSDSLGQHGRSDIHALTAPGSPPGAPARPRPQPEPTMRGLRPVPPVRPIRWARSRPHCRPAAPRPALGARPITCAGIPGFSRATAPTGSTTGWCRHLELMGLRALRKREYGDRQCSRSAGEVYLQARITTG